MRVNARFEGVAEQQVEYLVKTTGLKVSAVLRESVAHYYQQVRGENSGGLRHFSKLIGQGHSGRTDLSVNYKQYLAESLAAKYKLRPVADPNDNSASNVLPQEIP